MLKVRVFGFARARVNQEIYDLEEVPNLDKKFNHNIDAVIDRIVIKSDSKNRLNESIEIALQMSQGLISILKKFPSPQEAKKEATRKEASCISAAKKCLAEFYLSRTAASSRFPLEFFLYNIKKQSNFNFQPASFAISVALRNFFKSYIPELFSYEIQNWYNKIYSKALELLPQNFWLRRMPF